MADPEMQSSNSEDDEDYGPMTSAELVLKLEQVWLNEKSAPDILEHKTEYIECIFELIQQMEENIKHQPLDDFRIIVHKMEIDRIRYIVNNYLRCRFEKIQKNTSFIVQKHKETDASLLTAEELEFAKDVSADFQVNLEIQILTWAQVEKWFHLRFPAILIYLSSIQNHLDSLALQHMPGNLRSFDLKDTMPKPLSNHFVFFKALEDVPDILIDEDITGNRESVVDLKVNSQHLTKYKTISHLVKSGSVCLL